MRGKGGAGTSGLRARAAVALRASRELRESSADYRIQSRLLRNQLHRGKVTVHAYALTIRATAERAARVLETARQLFAVPRAVCVLCDSVLPLGTPIRDVTQTAPGMVCAACTALSIAERDVLRSYAMTRQLVRALGK